MVFQLNSVTISGVEVLPIVEGGKGVAISSGKSSGNFSKNNCIGTFSGVNATGYDEHGVAKEIIYHGKTRKERQW